MFVCVLPTHIKYKKRTRRGTPARGPALPPRRPRACRALPRSRVEGRAVATLSLVSSTSRGAAPRGAHGAARLPRCRSHDADVATASGSAEARPRGQVTGGAASQNPFGRCGRHGPLVLVMSALGTAQGVLTAARMLLRAHSATAPLAALDVVVGFFVFSLSFGLYLVYDSVCLFGRGRDGREPAAPPRGRGIGNIP